MVTEDMFQLQIPIIAHIAQSQEMCKHLTRMKERDLMEKTT